MTDPIGGAALALVLVGLAATAWAQVRPLRRGRALLDGLALVPEWRFFAQASIRAAAELARDPHLLVRDRDATGRAGGWRPALWPEPRRPSHAWWNPRGRVDAVILSIAEDLADACARAPAPGIQQSMGYLALLRAALAAPPAGVGAGHRQFAVVHAVGRGRRTLSVDFVSAWHPR